MNPLYRSLPTTIEVAGKEWDIRTDYYDVLYAISFFSDPDFEKSEAWEVCLNIIIKDYDELPKELVKEASEKIAEFIDMGAKNSNEPKPKRPRTMDWDQDASMIIAAVNKVAGTDIRTLPHVHWWTFMSWYMEIGECVFSQILNIRSKKAKGKKLEKWEEEFYRNNRDIIDLKRKVSEEQQEEIDFLNALLG